MGSMARLCGAHSLQSQDVAPNFISLFDIATILRNMFVCKNTVERYVGYSFVLESGRSLPGRRILEARAAQIF